MEAALSAMPWGEVKSVLSDLETLLEAGEETATLRTIKTLRADLEMLLAGRETDARRLIGGASAWKADKARGGCVPRAAMLPQPLTLHTPSNPRRPPSCRADVAPGERRGCSLRGAAVHG